MKNYQKILIPCAAAFVISLSAFVSGDEDITLPKTKVKSVTEANLSNVEGTDVVSSSVSFNTTKTKWSVSSNEESQSSSTVETSIATVAMLGESVSVESIIASYN